MSDFVMYKNCKKVIKYLKKFGENDIVDLKDLNVKNLRQTLKYLAENDYIDYYPILNGIGSAQLRFEGANYLEKHFIDIKNFLIKSILTPIIVAVVISIITTLITYYWLTQVLSQVIQK